MKVDRRAFSSWSRARELALYRTTCPNAAFCFSGDGTSRRDFFGVKRLKSDPGVDHFFVMCRPSGSDIGFLLIISVSACKQVTATK